MSLKYEPFLGCKALIWLLGAGLLTIIGLPVLFALIWFFKGPDLLVRYDKPLTYEQAMKEKYIGQFPFPKAAHDIYYAVHGDWQAYTNLVRFEAPVEDCERHIDEVIAWQNGIHKRTSVYPRIDVDHVESVGPGWLRPAAWFNPGSITHGWYVCKMDGHEPQIWIDRDKGIFYFKETD